MGLSTVGFEECVLCRAARENARSSCKVYALQAWISEERWTCSLLAQCLHDIAFRQTDRRQQCDDGTSECRSVCWADTRPAVIVLLNGDISENDYGIHLRADNGSHSVTLDPVPDHGMSRSRLLWVHTTIAFSSLQWYAFWSSEYGLWRVYFFII